MSGQPFKFPPPPPPPPRRTNGTYEAPPRGRGHHAGSAWRGASQRGRGRGQYFNRGRGGDGSYGHDQQRSPPPPAPFGSKSTSSFNNTYNQQNRDAAPHPKRDHTTAFGADALRKSRPQAAPAVPSFSANLANLLPVKPPSIPTIKEKSAKKDQKKNVLGLTPATAGDTDSEDDAGEEDKLASGRGQDLQFSYRGQTATLKTAFEIAAWIAERKRRFPTQAKREAAQKEADEKRKLWEAEKRARMEASQLARANREKQHKQKEVPKSPQVKREPTVPTDEPATAAKLHAERLRRKALKVQRDLAAAEALLEKHANGGATETAGSIEGSSSDEDSLGTLSDSSELSESSDSSSDDDGPPEVQSSKLLVPRASNLAEPGSRATKRPCTTFMKTGRCRFGSRCHYSHKRAERPTIVNHGQQPQQKPARKGLFQVMAEKEQDEEQRKLLSSIIALGEQGLLQQPS
jgi:hypothetical protein